MLFFIDESWQVVGGAQVGALGGVAIRRRGYNAFCREVYRIKGDVLGAQELTDSEIKGNSAFSRASFKRQALHGDSHWIETAVRVFDALERHGARVFAIFTRHPDLLDLRHHATTTLSQPYKQLLFDFRRYVEAEAAGDIGILHFDLRDVRQDEAAACTVQNYIARTDGGWADLFIQVPSFVVSSASPGLQAADLVAFLAAQRADRNARPELAEFQERLWQRRFTFRLEDGTLVGTVREVY